MANEITLTPSTRTTNFGSQENTNVNVSTTEFYGNTQLETVYKITPYASADEVFNSKAKNVTIRRPAWTRALMGLTIFSTTDDKTPAQINEIRDTLLGWGSYNFPDPAITPSSLTTSYRDSFHVYGVSNAKYIKISIDGTLYYTKNVTGTSWSSKTVTANTTVSLGTTGKTNYYVFKFVPTWGSETGFTITSYHNGSNSTTINNTSSYTFTLTKDTSGTGVTIQYRVGEDGTGSITSMSQAGTGEYMQFKNTLSQNINITNNEDSLTVTRVGSAPGLTPTSAVSGSMRIDLPKKLTYSGQVVNGFAASDAGQSYKSHLLQLSIDGDTVSGHTYDIPIRQFNPDITNTSINFDTVNATGGDILISPPIEGGNGTIIITTRSNTVTLPYTSTGIIYGSSHKLALTGGNRVNIGVNNITFDTSNLSSSPSFASISQFGSTNVYDVSVQADDDLYLYDNKGTDINVTLISATGLTISFPKPTWESYVIDTWIGYLKNGGTGVIKDPNSMKQVTFYIDNASVTNGILTLECIYSGQQAFTGASSQLTLGTVAASAAPGNIVYNNGDKNYVDVTVIRQ